MSIVYSPKLKDVDEESFNNYLVYVISSLNCNHKNYGETTSPQASFVSIPVTLEKVILDSFHFVGILYKKITRLMIVELYIEANNQLCWNF